jgi:hypothetical protein
LGLLETGLRGLSQQRNPNSGCGKAFGIGCLSIVGFFVVVTVIANLSVNHNLSGSHASAPVRHAHRMTDAGTIDWCSRANDMENESVKELNSGLYSSTYADSVKGLADNDQCSDDDEELVNHAYLLSMKGLSEHYLSHGDATTDLNQANTLLEECSTRPSFYGTHTGAQCETQMENNIRSKDDWEINQ